MQKLADELRSVRHIDQEFAERARRLSEAASAEDGGRIGWVGERGDLPEDVMAAIRRLGRGEISDPVVTPLGVHLVLLHDHQVGHGTFDELTDRAQLRRDAANALFDSLLDQQRGARVLWHDESLRPPVAWP
jgi:parvulin-like peptidyl-prolyl isomerase